MVLKLNYNSCKKLIYIQIIMVLCVFFLISTLHFPSFLSYVTDIINFLLLICIFKIRGAKLKQLGGKYINISIGVFIISIVLGIIFNLVSPILVAWGARNLFRGIIFFVACVKFLDEEDIEKIFKIFFCAQIINVLATLYQYFALGIKQDYLGGIFGTSQGCNGATNVFCIILLIYFGVSYINKNIPIYIFAVIGLTTLIIAALAEIKIYYMEFALIIVLVILFSKPSFRTFFVVGITIVGLFIAIDLMKKIFPLQYETLVNFELLKQYADAKGGGYNISRLNAFGDINRLFFHNNIILKLFGYGLGGCEMSSFSFLISDFYKMYGHYNYRWFTHMMIYLQNGLVGIVLYINIFVQIFIHAIRKRKIFNKINIYGIFVSILSILVIINIWYNQAMLTEVQYLIYFALSICLVQTKSNKYSENSIGRKDKK